MGEGPEMFGVSDILLQTPLHAKLGCLSLISAYITYVAVLGKSNYYSVLCISIALPCSKHCSAELLLRVGLIRVA